MQKEIFIRNSWYKILIVFVLILGTSQVSNAQWMLINKDGGTPVSTAALEIRDTTHGILFPRLTTVQMNLITSTEGLLVYNTDSSSIYFNNGSGWASIATSGASQFSVPTGSVVPFAGDSSLIPAGFLLCDGKSLSQSAYSELYSAIGKAWGGDATNFNLPDLRGRFMRGTAYGSTNDPDRAARTAINTGGNTGDKVGSVQGDEIESHNHQSNPRIGWGAGSLGAGWGRVDANNPANGWGGTSSSTGGNETRPINANVNYIICYSSSVGAAGTNSSVFQGSVSVSQLPASVQDSTRITDADGTAKVKVDGSDNIVFTTSGTENMRVESSGNVNVKKTLNVDGKSGSFTLSLKSPSDDDWMAFENSLGTKVFDIGFSGGNKMVFSQFGVGPLLTLQNGGKVGVNTNNPDSTLTINGGIKTTYFTMTDGTSLNGKVLTSNADGRATWQTPVSGADNLGDHKATQTLQLNGNKISGDGDNEGISVDNSGKVVVSVAAGSSGSGNAVLRANGDIWTDGQGTGYYMSNSSIGITGNNSNSGDMRFKTIGNDRVRILKTGQVGIGTTTPDSLLTVDGGIKTTYFTMTDGTSLNGKVLTSNADGRATWQTPSTSPWTVSGNNIYRNDAAGTVIIGATSAPAGHIAYMYNNTSTKAIALKVHSDYTGASTKIGIDNYVAANGSGPRTGIKNVVYGSGANAATGFDLQMLSGTGTKYAYKASLAGTGTNYGLYITGEDKNYLSGGLLVGTSSVPASYWSEIQTPTGSTYAIGFSVDQNYTGAAQTFGVNSDISSTGTGVKYGFYSTLNANASQSNDMVGNFNKMNTNSTGDNYGVYNQFNGSGTGNRYGVYNTGEDYNYFSGDVGIGTNSPKVPLQITNGNDASLNATNGYMVIGNTSSTNLVFDNNEILARDNGGTSFLALNANGGAISMHAGINDVNRWGVLLDDGNFLLGDTITANRTKLRVAGRVLADTLAVLNGVQFPLDKGTNGQVLTSDGAGLAKWQAATSSPWSISGSNVYRSSGNVGIGTSSPSTLFHIEQGSGADVMARIEKTTNGNDASMEIVGARQGATWSTDIAYLDLNNYDANENGGTEFTMSRITGFTSLNSQERGGLKIYINNGTSGKGLQPAFQINQDGETKLGSDSLSGVLRIASDQGATDYALIIKPSASMTQITTYTFPVDDGDANEMLTTDGSGILSWTAPASSPWSVSGSDVYRSSGFVGIGTTTPSSQLTIYGDSSSALTLKSSDNTKNHGIAFQNSGNSFSWTIKRVNSSTANNPDFVIAGGTIDPDIEDLPEHMRITHAGNFGIGESNPTSKLHVNGTTRIDQTPVSTTGFAIRRSDDSTAILKVFTGSGENGNVSLHDATGSVGVRLSSGTDNSHFNGTGNFGIGTNSPKNKLQVNSLTSVTRLQLTNSTSGSGVADGLLISSDATNALFTNQESGDIEFNTNGADRMVIKSDGDVGMGTMSPNWNLQVHGSSTTSFAQFTNSSTGSTATDGLEIGQSGTQTFIRNQENDNLKLGTNNTVRLTITGSGDVGIGTTNPSYDLDVVGNINASLTVRAAGVALLSDKRYKTDITPLKNTLASLQLLQGIYHNWDTINFPDQQFPEGKAIGVIAQDMQKVYPELVYENSDGYLAVDYAKFSTVLLEAIKEQQVEIETLKASVSKKEEDNDSLKSELGDFEDRLKRLEFLIESKNISTAIPNGK